MMNLYLLLTEIYRFYHSKPEDTEKIIICTIFARNNIAV